MKSLDEQFAESMFITTHAWRIALDRQLRPLGFTLSRWLLLLHLSRNNGCTHSELAQSMGIEAATLVRLVTHMEKDGLLSRCSSETDRRVKHLRLSDNGHAAVLNIRSCASDLRGKLLSGLSTDEINTALKVTKHIRQNLGALA